MFGCDVWRQKGGGCCKETAEDRGMEEQSINDEEGLMCKGEVRGTWGGKVGEWMDGGLGYEDGCGGEGEIDRWTVKGRV